MRALVAVLVAASALALNGCAPRERANPFDPANQVTAGRPAGFVALAGDQQVNLNWQALPYAGLVGYQVFRRTALDSGYRAISNVLAPGASQFIDRGLLNGLEHSYRLYYVFGAGPTGDPAEDAAVPGHARPWMADAGTGVLARLTPDGRHVAESRGGMVAAVAVGVDSLTGRVWCSDAGGDQVQVLDPWSEATVSIPIRGTPGEIAVVPGDSSVWVCNETGGEVVHLDTQGRRLDTVAHLATPIGVAVAPLDHSLWICERDGNQVLHLDIELGTLSTTPLPKPSRVAVDSRDGSVWVSSFSSQQVWMLHPDGSVAHTVGGFTGPVGIALDERRDRVWVADPAGNRVFQLRLDGTVELTLPSMPARAPSRWTTTPVTSGLRSRARARWCACRRAARCCGASAGS